MFATWGLAQPITIKSLDTEYVITREYLLMEFSCCLFQESKKHLSQLASLGALGPLVEDISSENQQEEGSSSSSQDGKAL